VVAQEPVWCGGGVKQDLRWRGSPDLDGDVDAEELRPDGPLMTTMAFGSRQRPGGDPTTPSDGEGGYTWTKSKKKGRSHGAHRMGERVAAAAPISTGATAFRRLERQNEFREWRRRRRARAWTRGCGAKEWRTGARGGSFTVEAAQREKGEGGSPGGR
jgi:hypothetical protein